MHKPKFTREEKVMLREWRRNVKACIEGNDPLADTDYCKQCGMHFKDRTPGGSFPELTTCAEPGCGRRFAHGSAHIEGADHSTQPVTLYRVDRHMPDLGP